MVIISMIALCEWYYIIIIIIVEYDRRRSELSSAPLDMESGNNRTEI